MKKTIIPIALLFVVAFTSCEKCADCACENAVSVEFDSDFSGNEDVTEAAYTTGVNNTYPANATELCGKKKDLEEDINDYESESRTIVDEENSGFTGNIVRTCTCVEQ